MSQVDAILKRLSRGDALSALDALNDPEIRCMRLSARIEDIEKMGHVIEKVMIESPEGKRYAKYRLARLIEPSGQVLMGGLR